MLGSGVGNGPQGVAVTPDGATAYVANFNGGDVTPIDVATNTAGTVIRRRQRPGRGGGHAGRGVAPCAGMPGRRAGLAGRGKPRWRGGRRRSRAARSPGPFPSPPPSTPCRMPGASRIEAPRACPRGADRADGRGCQDRGVGGMPAGQEDATRLLTPGAPTRSRSGAGSGRASRTAPRAPRAR